MSVCDMCAHFGRRQEKQCAFSGNCIVNTYNLRDTGTLKAFIDEKPEDAVVQEEPVSAIENNVVDMDFNPFQRGNGCLLVDIAKSHTR